ncbi:EpsG family protein [Salinisphaera japonica]|uniref:EpsG family protein n=1 Tax=Salinisphaera japonica YTM-1 TaxID=1209778 RepID=A0A423PLF6_9GAMM|nr:EpsG family protein [Salinisphaera japonica]ROO26351.1 hypothetical protein SAJA_11380 [Salinisphaera japonica YTM-1]
MIAYWVVYLAASFLAIARLRVSALGWGLIVTGLTVFVGLRYQVGGDWDSYLYYLVRVANSSSVTEILGYKDPGYQLLNGLSFTLGFDVWFVNLVAAAFYSVGLVLFIRTLPDPKVALAVAIPYMTIVMAMGYTRQAMAFGCILWGLTYLRERRLLGFVALLALGTTFHKSAVILMPLAVLANTKNRAWTALWVGTTAIILFVLFVQSHVDQLYSSYVASDYSDASQGGAIRAAMNVLPALVYLLFHRRLVLEDQERSLWYWISWLALACVPLLAVSTTAVDRVALYLMPIQLVIASHFTYFFSAASRVLARSLLLAFYGVVLFVWLNFASHSNFWLPYRFWPLA